MTEDDIKVFLAKLNNPLPKSNKPGSTRPVESPVIKKVVFSPFEPNRGKGNLKTSFTHFEDVMVNVSAVLGSAVLKARDLAELKHGSLIKLDCQAGDPVTIKVNDQKLGTGEVLVLGESFGVRVTSIEFSPYLKTMEAVK